MGQSNLEKFRSAVAATLGLAPEEVNDQLSSETLDTWDSLNHINLISALEQEFGVMLPTEGLVATQSVAGLKAMLAEHGVAL
jgi:acyl carrier protein